MNEALWQDLDWRNAWWLGLALVPWVQWIISRLLRRGHQGDYADAALMPWVRAAASNQPGWLQQWRHGALALAWLLFAMAMAGPRYPASIYMLDQKDNTELIVVLDLSRSMSARDVSPDRLERAKLELHDLIERAHDVKIGLVVFAARPHLLLPPTADKTVLRHQLQALRHGLLPTEGSDISAALEFAAATFSADQPRRALLLVSDGEKPLADDSATQALEATVTRLQQQGITLHALGVGTPEGAPLLTLEGEWLQHNGQAVQSHLDKSRLARLAALGNGRYADFSATDAEWSLLYDRGIARLLSTDASSAEHKLIIWQELQAWALVPAVMLLLLIYLRPRRHGLPTIPHSITIVTIAVVLVLPLPLQASDNVWQQAWQAWAAEDYDSAGKAYAAIAGYPGRMGEGASAYRLKRYQTAIQQFTLAVLEADNDEQRANALFNLANSHYQRQDYARAANYYQDVLRYRSTDTAARTNLALSQTQLQRQQQSGDTAFARQGRGPRTARLAPGTSIGKGSVSLDEDESASNPERSHGDTRTAVGGDAIDRTALLAQPASTELDTFQDQHWHYDSTTTDRIILQAGAMRTDESQLWQRMFETEEEIPAPLAAPLELPGIAPW